MRRHVKPENPNAFQEFGFSLMERALGIKTPEEGAATSIYLASSADVEGITGKYYENCKPMVANWKAYVADSRKRFWDLSCEMTGEEFDVAVLVEATTPAAVAH